MTRHDEPAEGDVATAWCGNHGESHPRHRWSLLPDAEGSVDDLWCPGNGETVTLADEERLQISAVVHQNYYMPDVFETVERVITERLNCEGDVAGVLAEHEPVLGRFGPLVGIVGCSCLSARDYRAAGFSAGQEGWRAHVADALRGLLAAAEQCGRVAALREAADECGRERRWQVEREHRTKPGSTDRIAHVYAEKRVAVLEAILRDRATERAQ